MMTLTQTTWSTKEKQIAEQVLEKAYKQEINSLIDKVRKKITNLINIDELWQLHDLLSAKRYELDGKYDTRESMLVFSFAQLLKENLIDLEDLQGLDQDKLAKISSLAKI
jgi:hypothetical protein